MKISKTSRASSKAAKSLQNQASHALKTWFFRLNRMRVSILSLHYRKLMMMNTSYAILFLMILILKRFSWESELMMVPCPDKSPDIQKVAPKYLSRSSSRLSRKKMMKTTMASVLASSDSANRPQQKLWYLRQLLKTAKMESNWSQSLRKPRLELPPSQKMNKNV